MITAEALRDRFQNLLEVKGFLSLEEISATFNEVDLKSLIWVLGDYIAITGRVPVETTEENARAKIVQGRSEQ